MHVIFSLKPEFADLILSGKKTVELRNRTINLTQGTTVWIYATKPTARIVAVAQVVEVVNDHPKLIWQRFQMGICVAQRMFREYTRNKEKASALVLDAVKEVESSITLEFLRERVGSFHPPQFYARITRGSALWNVLMQSVVTN